MYTLLECHLNLDLEDEDDISKESHLLFSGLGSFSTRFIEQAY